MEDIAIHEKLISGMCRLCLSSDGALIDMFSFSSELESKIADAVTKCTSVHVEKHSELPRTICESCYMQLIKTQNFQTQALKSDKTLQVYLQRLHNRDKQSILGSSEILPNIDGNFSLEMNVANQDKEYNSTNSKEIKSDDKYSERGCEEPEMNIVENKVFALDSRSTTEWDGHNSNKDSAFNPNLIIKAEPKISDKDLFDNNTDILNDFAVAQTNIKPENEESNDKIMASYQCDVCYKYFINSDVLREHQQVHSGEKSYHCDLCNKSFVHLSNFKTHLYLHTEEKSYKCDVCNKCFKKKGEMKKHQRVHTGEKPYQCDVCAKCFSSSANFRRHQRVHTGEKPYRCGVCNKCFSFPSSFKNHRRIHTGEKPYQCDVCNKNFSTINHLRTHQRVHTGAKPYRCDFCNKNYSSSDYLKRHQRIHTGEKPIKCDDCNKCFSNSSTLRIHQRVHTGEKPYQCDVCSKCFTQLRALNTHKHKHSSDV